MKALTLIITLVLSTLGFSSVLNLNSLGNGTSVVIEYNGNNVSTYAGAISSDLDGGSSFDAYCADLNHVSYVPGNYTVTNLYTPSLPNGNRVGWLLNTYGWQVDYIPSSGAEHAALQVAIWDVIYDGGDGFSSGNFKLVSAPSTAYSLGNYFLKKSKNQSDVANYYVADNHGVNGLYNQNMVSAVPEPYSGLLFVLGGLSLLVNRRKAQKGGVA